MADILIVEDDADLAATLGDLLGLYGHTTRVAYDGQEALHAVEERKPDVMVLDIEMPVLDGPGTAAALVAEDAGKELIPIILSSGYGDLARVADRVGTPYRIAKPSSVDALAELIERAVVERCPPRPLLHALPSSQTPQTVTEEQRR